MGVVEIQQIDYHRNGVSGEGFYSVRFICPDMGSMHATIFPPKKDSGVLCAVHNIDRLSTTCAFFQNSWKGDEYLIDICDALGILYSDLSDPGFCIENYVKPELFGIQDQTT